jgi:hypothetical protein
VRLNFPGRFAEAYRKLKKMISDPIARNGQNKARSKKAMNFNVAAFMRNVLITAAKLGAVLCSNVKFRSTVR